MTGLSDFKTSCSKFASVNSRVCPPAILSTSSITQPIGCLSLRICYALGPGQGLIDLQILPGGRTPGKVLLHPVLNQSAPDFRPMIHVNRLADYAEQRPGRVITELETRSRVA